MKKYFKYIYITLICILTIIMPNKTYANSITLNKSRITLGVGYSETLTYNLGEGLSDRDIIWTSSDESIVTINKGKAIAISEGSAIVTASINGKSSTCRITVIKNYISVTGIKLNKNKTTMLVGQTEKLNATITPSDSTNKDIQWSSSDESVVTVNSTGTITAKSAGTATITVSISGFTAKCEVTVTYSLSLKGISLNKQKLTLKEKSAEQLNITYNPSNATNKKVTWKSSNENVAIVSSTGKVTAISKGSAIITAISNDGGYTSSCEVTVEEISKKVTAIDLEQKEISVIVGETSELKAIITPDYAENKKVTWKSSDESIATVENGIVTAIYPGTAEITVKSVDGDKEAVCKVIVTSPPIEAISFAEPEQTVFIGSQTNLHLIATPNGAVLENPIWTSSDETVAIVENGKITALSLGETTITVTNQDNTLTTSINIIVIEKPREPINITIEGYNLSFKENKKNYTLKIGKEEKLNIKTNVDSKYVNIKGNQNLKNQSIITITITEKEPITYIINIKKKQNYTIYFIAAVSVLLLLNLIRILLKNKKKSNF